MTSRTVLPAAASTSALVGLCLSFSFKPRTRCHPKRSARVSAKDVDEPVLIGYDRAFPAVIDDHAPRHPAGVEDVLDPALRRIDDPDLARVISLPHVNTAPIL